MSKKLTEMQVLALAADDMLMYVAYKGKDFAFPLGLIKTLIAVPTRESLGIDKVDNTADIDKPMSLEVQQAISTLMTKDAEIPISQIKDLVTVLESKADTTAVNQQLVIINQTLANKRDKNTKLNISEIESLTESLAALANKEHRHLDYEQSIQDIIIALDSVAAKNHSHRINEIDGLNEALNNRPTTEAVNQLLLEKANKTDITTTFNRSVW